MSMVRMILVRNPLIDVNSVDQGAGGVSNSYAKGEYEPK